MSWSLKCPHCGRACLCPSVVTGEEINARLDKLIGYKAPKPPGLIRRFCRRIADCFRVPK